MPGGGGAVLDDCGGFGATAHSGDNFLAFISSATLQNGMPAQGPTTIDFANAVQSASIWGAGGNGPGATIQMEAFQGLVSVALDTQSVGGGNQWVQLSVANAGGFDRLVVREISGKSAWMLDDLEFGGTSAFVAYCFGDGTGTLCPCGNTGATGRGCDNGTGSGGALLGAVGSNSVSAADLVLQGVGMQAGQPGLYFQGNNATNAGLGFANGDGLRCAGGNLKRIQVRLADVNGSSSTTVNVAAQGLVLAGDTRRYQLWYRSPATSPCGTTFNLSNGIETTWAP